MNMRKTLAVLAVGTSVLGGYATSRAAATLPATCVHTSTVTCTYVPTSVGLTPGSIAQGVYQDDVNTPSEGEFVVADTPTTTLAALNEGRTCMDIGVSPLDRRFRQYLCVKRVS
jgi:hypothetical protein